jgi:hypothetical protein
MQQHAQHSNHFYCINCGNADNRCYRPSVQEALALHDSLGHNQGITHRSEESLGQDTPADESANNNNDHGKECGNLDDEDAHSGFTNTPSDQPPGCID